MKKKRSTYTLQLPGRLNRFTSWKELKRLAQTKKLVLRETTSWEDKNDVEVIQEYERHKGKKVLAKCFCSCIETIHHWKAFAAGIDGCCIRFDTKKLLEYVEKVDDGNDNLMKGPVRYKYIENVESIRPHLNFYPFIKRKPYRIEHEYRIIWLGTQDDTAKEIPIQWDCITRITFSPEVDKKVFLARSEFLRKISGRNDEQLTINKSTVMKNRAWIKAFRLSN
jgi:hypothetical protein